MKSVYLAHSMTNGNQNLDRLNTLISWLKKKRFRISKPDHILFSDYIASGALDSIEKSDIVIADVTVYSHGVGFELGYAYSLKKNIILISGIAAKNKISKFLLGLFPKIIFYHDSNDLIDKIALQLKSFRKKE